MTDSISKEIKQGWQLFNEWKEEEALRLIINIEKKDDLTPEEKLECQCLRGRLVHFLGRFGEALRIGELIYQESKTLKKPLFAIDGIHIKFYALWILGKLHESWELVESCEDLLKSAHQEPSPEIELREAFVNSMKGIFFSWEMDLDHALESFEKCLYVYEHHPKFGFFIPHILNVIGSAYDLKGELEKSLKYHKKSLKLVKESSVVSKFIIGGNYFSIGSIYYQKCNYDLSIEYFKKCQKLWEQSHFVILLGRVYKSLIIAFLDKNSPELAEEYLDRFYRFNEKNEFLTNFYWYKLSKARILKSSTRTRDRAEAEKILKELIEKHDAAKTTMNRGLEEEPTEVLIELCDLYLKELQATHNLVILDDIHPVITKLIKESERRNSYSVQAQTYLLQGKISLITFKIKEARRFLTQAERIAERHGLVQLVTEISSLHEDITQQLEIWENLEEINAPVSKRMELAHLSKDLAKSIRSRLVKAARVSEKSVTIYKEQKKCLVCKGNIEGFNNYICPKCDSIYCEKCARALIKLENVCWACDVPIDYSKPVKQFKEEEERVEIGEEAKKK